MKIEFIRKYRGKEIGQVDDVPDRVAHRFVNKGLAKFVKEKTKSKSKVKKLSAVSKRKIWK